jgi:hypothetical protein
MRLGRPEEAFFTSERARVRVLLDAMGDTARIVPAAPPELLARREALRRQINLIPKLTTSPADVGALLASYRAVDAEIAGRSPRASALTRPRPMRADEIADLLSPDVALVEFSLGESGSYLFAVTRVGLETFELPAGSEIARLA